MVQLPQLEEPRLDDDGGDSFGTDQPGRARRGRRLILRGTAVLPAAFTLLNAICGFTSIHFATKDALGDASVVNLAVAAWLIFASMVCDMLDGRLARMTRRTSDFGAQLDSMADVISFGVAPAMLMLRTVVMVLRGQVDKLTVLPMFPHVEQVIWAIAAVYVACAALRLARFNVENQPDESSHMGFKGLPSPGAAAPVAALVLLFAQLEPKHAGWQSHPWILGVVSFALPVLTLACGLLMVSNFRYSHIVNQYLHTRKPFGYLVKLTLIAFAAAMAPLFTAAVLTLGYAMSAPARALWRKMRGMNTIAMEQAGSTEG